MARFESIGVIRNNATFDADKLSRFVDAVISLRQRGRWEKRELVELFLSMLPDFGHKETGKYLDGRM